MLVSVSVSVSISAVVIAGVSVGAGVSGVVCVCVLVLVLMLGVLLFVVLSVNFGSYVSFNAPTKASESIKYKHLKYLNTTVNGKKFEKLGASHIPGNPELQWARNLLSHRRRGKTVKLSFREISQLYYVSFYIYSVNTKVVPRIA